MWFTVPVYYDTCVRVQYTTVHTSTSKNLYGINEYSMYGYMCVYILAVIPNGIELKFSKNKVHCVKNMKVSKY